MMSNSHAGNLLPDAYEITLGAENQKDEYGFLLRFHYRGYQEMLKLS